MINRTILILLIFILSTLTIYAEPINIKIYRTEYSIGETFQADIIINTNITKELQTNNIKLLKEDGNVINLPLTLIKKDDNYFTYFNVPQLNPGNYKLEIPDIYYYQDELLKKDTFSKSFQIKERKENIISINPGYYKNIVRDYDESPFSLIINNNGNNSVEINLETNNDIIDLTQKKFNLNPNSRKILNIGTILYNKEGNNFNGNILINRMLTKIENNITAQNKTMKNNTTQIIITNQNFDVKIGDAFGGKIENINLTTSKKETFNADLSIINNMNFSLNNITLEVTENLKDIIEISPVSLDNLGSEVIYPINIVVNKNKNLDKDYVGNISININSKFVYSIPFSIYLKKEVQPIKINNTINNEVNITRITATPKDKNNFGIWILLSIVVLILLILIIYFYTKTKNKPKNEFDDFIQANLRR